MVTLLRMMAACKAEVIRPAASFQPIYSSSMQPLNITEEVLRYLLVTVDEKGRALLAEAAAKKSDEASEDAEA